MSNCPIALKFDKRNEVSEARCATNLTMTSSIDNYPQGVVRDDTFSVPKLFQMQFFHE